ncbi:MAG TPA: hypothetical protein PKU96_02385 [bacterium]|jgi:predicted CopG family antitoxin|nr:hypothetical protein [Myxococcales bacterium]OQA62055.1 MAG: hypothetical protein BWY40_00307 [bacterium ADurb.Bin270]HPW45201.1 hypothetical protein [bacterium]HQC50405.1 hypothetical protein [bacterium]HQG13764.1 hypothetical protein [bacterium]
MGQTTIIHGDKLAQVLHEDVRHAFEKMHVHTDDIVEFYIVNLLQEFHNAEGLVMFKGDDAVEKPLSIMLLEALTGGSAMRVKCLRQVGDKALVVSGFFGDNIHSGLMDISYYIGIGESAYGALAKIHKDCGAFSDLYLELAKKFEQFVDVISSIAPWNNARSDVDLMRIYERWIITGDDTLGELLELKGIPTSKKPFK